MPQKQVLVRGADVIDGTGAAARRADVLVTSDYIEAVEPPGSLPVNGRTVLDCEGATLTPGFIDVHSHADNAPFLHDDDTSKILQGVTTEIVGNCGFSLAPRVGEHAAALESYSLRIFPPITWRWNTFRELLAAADERGYVTNYAPLVGHHALRIAAMGMSDAAPDDRELRVMGELLDEAVQAGAFGLSTGLIYPPGLFAETHEIECLASRLPQGRLYATHMRGEGRQLQSSIAEAVRVGEHSRRRVQVSHLKAAGKANWGSMPQALALLDEARARGVDVRHDVYPYTAGSTMLTATLPPYFQEGGEPNVLRRLQDPESVARLREDLAADDGSWENQVIGAGWDGIVVASSVTHRFDGMSIAEIAADKGAEPFDALVDVLLVEELKVSMIVFSMQEDDLREALRHPLTMVGSDGLPPGVGGKPHPRMYGTFPRVLARYCREQRMFPVEEAVRRMTSLPADTFGLADRGSITPGSAADLVALDAATVQDRADYRESTRSPTGIHWIMQGGTVVARDGRYLGPRAGRRLLPAG
jgi:N-acyl-D-aspartate/D-glutamate deacylase